LISKVTGFPVHDLGCTLKVIRREIAQELELYGEMHRFIPILAHWQGARCVEVETKHHARRFGTTKYGIWRPVRVIPDLMPVGVIDVLEVIHVQHHRTKRQLVVSTMTVDLLGMLESGDAGSVKQLGLWVGVVVGTVIDGRSPLALVALDSPADGMRRIALLATDAVGICGVLGFIEAAVILGSVNLWYNAVLIYATLLAGLVPLEMGFGWAQATPLLSGRLPAPPTAKRMSRPPVVPGEMLANAPLRSR